MLDGKPVGGVIIKVDGDRGDLFLLRMPDTTRMQGNATPAGVMIMPLYV